MACSIEEGKAKFVTFFLKRPPPDNVGIFKSVNDVLPDLRLYSILRS